MLQSLVRIVEGKLPAARASEQSGYEFPELSAGNSQELQEALQQAGIIGRAFRELLRLDVDPVVVRAWYLWTWVPEREWMDNPTGYFVLHTYSPRMINGK